MSDLARKTGMAAAAAICLGQAQVVAQTTETSRKFVPEIDYHAMTSAEQTAARQEARRRTYTQLTFCADPGNMPLSNNRGEGLQNKIALAVGKQMGASVSFFWRPFFERGLTRETFDNKECEIIIEVPEGYGHIITSQPIYKSTYVWVTHEDAAFEITDFDDPDLREKNVGVFQHSAMREALSRHGVKEGLDLHVLSYDADLRPEKQPWNQVRRVAEGDLDVAGVWGPFAGWVKSQGAPIALTPANLMEDQVVLEFGMSFGVRTNDAVLKYALDFALNDARAEIAEILAAFNVPLVTCAECVVSGDIPAHGTYFEDIMQRAQERFIQQIPEGYRELDLTKASLDQVVTIERLQQALDADARPATELANAVVASDELRVSYLLDQGVDPNASDLLGAAPLVTAAKNRDPEMIALLVGRGGDVNAADLQGMTPLHQAVLRNHVPTIQALVSAGADIEKPTTTGLTPLALAISEGMRWSSAALLDLGASIDQRFGRDGLTPLMVLATQDPSKSRNARVNGGPSVIEIAEKLVATGADVNAVTDHGITALMIAAGGEHNAMLAFLLKAGADAEMQNRKGQTALDIAELSRSTQAAKALGVLSRFKN